MEKVIFKLKEPQKGIQKSKQIPTLVYMFFTFGYYEVLNNGTKKYLPLKYSTGLKITPYFWKDKPDYRARETKEFDHVSFNRKLKSLENHAIKLHRDLESKGKIVTPDMMRDELNKAQGKGPDIYRMNLKEFIQLVIRDSTDGSRLTHNGKKLSETTVKGYTTTLNHLIKYQDETGKSLSFDQIDLKFYKAFTSYLLKKKYATNTVGKNVKNIKVFLKEAYKRGLTTNKIFEEEDFRVTEEDTDQIYLKDEEIMKIYNLDLKADERLDKVRDLFIVGCYTGLRFSDLSQIHEENFIENNTQIRIRTQKTGELVVIPMHYVIREIHKKYDGKLPRMISSQKFNKYLKELGEKAKINSPVFKSLTKGGLRVNKPVEKYKMMVAHTARRSFATNMFLANVPSISIMKITGHHTEKNFMKYIRISQEDNATKIGDHPFFKIDSSLKAVK
jgi:integrase